MFKEDEIVVVKSHFKGKFLYGGVRCRVITSNDVGTKIEILEGPGTGRKLLSSTSKFILEVNREAVFIEPRSRFRNGHIINTISEEQFDIMFSDNSEFAHGGYASDYCSLRGRVVCDDYDKNADGSYVVLVRILEGDYEGHEVLFNENEIQEYYEKKKKYRIGYTTTKGKIMNSVVDANSLEDAKSSLKDVKEIHYHIDL